MRSATRWPAVAAALRRPNGNAVGASRTWHFGERCPSPKGPVRSAPIAFPFGLHNATATVGHPLALRVVQSPMDIEFMGAIEHDIETLYGLLNEELGSLSSSDSSRGSHHPSRECFMA